MEHTLVSRARVWSSASPTPRATSCQARRVLFAFRE